MYRILGYLQEPATVTEPCKAQDRGRSIVGIAGSNPAESMDLLRLCPLCVAWIQTFRVFLLGVCVCVCVCVCDLETSTKRRNRPDLGCCSPKDTFILN